MRPNTAIFIASCVAYLQASAAAIVFSHTPKSAGPGEPAASAAAPAASEADRTTDDDAEAGPSKVWVGDHWASIPHQIPKKIWVTGKWSSDSAEVNAEISHNIGDAIVENRSKDIKDSKEYQDIVREQVESYFARYVPIGSYVRYFTDKDMDNDVRDISKQLNMLGIRDIYSLYRNLRPGAYRADVWRLLKLWKEGGVYMDANLNLTRKITDWIDFSKDELVLVHDRGVANGYWNAIMASNENNDYLKHAIGYIASNLRRHYYGHSSLGITGPEAVWAGVHGQSGFPAGIRVDLEWKDGKVQDKKGAVMARKVEALHDNNDPSRHYHQLYHAHQVYCSEPGPKPDNGMCAPRR